MKESYWSKYCRYLTLLRCPSQWMIGSMVPSPMTPVSTMVFGLNFEFWWQNFLLGLPRGR